MEQQDHAEPQKKVIFKFFEDDRINPEGLIFGSSGAICL
jgi:hypothetical protein